MHSAAGLSWGLEHTGAADLGTPWDAGTLTLENSQATNTINQ